MFEVQPKRIKPGGSIMDVGISGSEQLVLLVWLDEEASRVLGLDLGGKMSWQFDVPNSRNNLLFSRLRKLRIADDGFVWLRKGRTLTGLAPNGQVRGTIDVDVGPGEELGDFLLVPGGLIAAIYRPVRGKADEVSGRVARLDVTGKVRWTTTLPADHVSFCGVVEMSVETGWKVRRKKPWLPWAWQPAWRGESLLLWNDRLVARYFEYRSGLGRGYCLDWANGSILWVTASRPEASVVSIGQSAWLLGVQGYDAFDLYLYDRDGQERQHWLSHAEVVLTEGGEIRGVEIENRLPSRMHFSIFLPDGTVRKGPHLDGYYSTYPVVNQAGVTAFWRDGKLRTVDASLNERMLWQDTSLIDKKLMTRMLLTNDGTLIFGLEDELFLVPTDLGPMAHSPWPCGGGNARGNPAFGG